MGTSKSGAELAAKLHRAGAVVVNGNRSNVEALSLAIKTSVLAEAAPATGGDLKFSGAKNGKVGVRYDLMSGGAVAQAKVRATGPMHWLEGGVKPHGIAPKGAGGNRAARSAAAASIGRGRSVSFGGRGGFLKFKDGTFAKYARNAGGLPAKNVWSHGVDRVEGRQGEIVGRNVVRQMSSVF